MNAEQLRRIMARLPHVEETVQWGNNLLFWVADKAIGGKMFAVANLDPDDHGVISFAADPEQFAELVEQPGIFPAPYMGHIHWVALQSWDVLRTRELEVLLQAAHARTFNKLPQRTRDVLAMEPAARDKIIRERRALLATRDAAEKAAKTAKKKGRKAPPATAPAAKAAAKVARKRGVR